MKGLGLSLCFLFLLIGGARAQCIDSTKIDPFNRSCNRQYYEPVCACNVTYFNACVAERNFGVLPTAWKAGTCSEFDFEFYPNILGGTDNRFMQFFIQFKKTQGNDAVLLIIDIYGKVRLQRFIRPAFDREQFQFTEPATFETGVYFLAVYTDSEIKIRRFVVVN